MSALAFMPLYLDFWWCAVDVWWCAVMCGFQALPDLAKQSACIALCYNVVERTAYI